MPIVQGSTPNPSPIGTSQTVPSPVYGNPKYESSLRNHMVEYVKRYFDSDKKDKKVTGYLKMADHLSKQIRESGVPGIDKQRFLNGVRFVAEQAIREAKNPEEIKGVLNGLRAAFASGKLDDAPIGDGTLDRAGKFNEFVRRLSPTIHARQTQSSFDPAGKKEAKKAAKAAGAQSAAKTPDGSKPAKEPKATAGIRPVYETYGQELKFPPPVSAPPPAFGVQGLTPAQVASVADLNLSVAYQKQAKPLGLEAQLATVGADRKSKLQPEIAAVPAMADASPTQSEERVISAQLPRSMMPVSWPEAQTKPPDTIA